MTELRRHILELLAKRGDSRLQILFIALQTSSPNTFSRQKALQEVWQMIGEGLVYFDCSANTSSNWELLISEKGSQVLNNSDDFNPYDPDGYLSRLKTRVPKINPTVLLYASESLRAFNAGCYLSTMVMLGVASEKAFLLVAESFASWLPKNQSESFSSILRNLKQNMTAKFSEFRKKLEPYKPKLPGEFADNMALTLDSVLDLIRLNRNESGHPTGKTVQSEDAYIMLQMFATYLKKLFALIEYFDSSTNS
jgi:hypothetical protein